MNVHSDRQFRVYDLAMEPCADIENNAFFVLCRSWDILSLSLG